MAVLTLHVQELEHQLLALEDWRKGLEVLQGGSALCTAAAWRRVERDGDVEGGVPALSGGRANDGRPVNQ